MKRIVLFTVMFTLLLSCSDYDDNTDLNLEGNWTLRSTTCYCAFGKDPDFGGHELTFYGNRVGVDNTGEFEFLTDAASLFFSNGKTITFASGKQYNYRIDGDILELSFVDEPGIADDKLMLAHRRGIPC